MQASGPTGKFADDILEILAQGADDFALGPDEFVDVLRLPKSVISLPTLMDHLLSIKAQLGSRDNKISTEDWDVAKRGDLRLYKMFACAIHALNDYLQTSPDFGLSIMNFAEQAVAYGRVHPPPGLAKGGLKMWTSNFEAPCPRLISCMATLVFFCKSNGISDDSDDDNAMPDLDKGDDTDEGDVE